ncbi:hypothetical protein N7520_005192 [Penicillium odoratum]|uniref:uncharacterized protein n=1 Tax=Penicillium odoratum TaxID=1167516 RepID=UPI002546893B|nr:uncharacterized protein N7520_005192 [Penicillium odoratum]KAJ5765633.1 hypothetical protein N7520_005192 [Penicillium odoratum]
MGASTDTIQSFPEYIPSCAGEGRHRKQVQRRTLTYWMAISTLALIQFNTSGWSPQTRAAILSLLFPGAGYIACANALGLFLVVVTLLLLPITLFAWFGACGLAFPLLLWAFSIPGAYFAASDALYEKAWVVAVILQAAPILYLNRSSSQARASAITKRKDRNLQLPLALERVQTSAVSVSPDEDRELTLWELRRVQRLFDVGLQSIDDWSNFSFQTSALRYQLYELIFCLSMYQGIYTPNFHGYCSEASRATIEKFLTTKVLGFWKWETLWGKFSTDLDPITKDNIMVSGFLLQVVTLYTANTGDMRYTKPGSLVCKVTPKHIYKHDLHHISKALVQQWKANPYTLFPCEPNWIYSPCNLQGMVGQVIYDRIFGTTHAKCLILGFEASLTSEFMEPSGSIIPIRSEITGFTIPGLCGAIGDLVNSMMCRGNLDHIARRLWATFRHENLHISDEGTKEGNFKMVGLVGADMMDPGNYKANPLAMLPFVAHVAGEFGDEWIREKALQNLDKEFGWTVNATGSVVLFPERVSFSTQTAAIKATMLRQGDWKRLVNEGPTKTTLQGPILDQVPYPGVLVAKARSITLRDLHFVLYPSAESGLFKLGITRLQPNGRYTNSGIELVADATGNAELNIFVDGRTEIQLVPQIN